MKKAGVPVTPTADASSISFLTSASCAGLDKQAVHLSISTPNTLCKSSQIRVAEFGLISHQYTVHVPVFVLFTSTVGSNCSGDGTIVESKREVAIDNLQLTRIGSQQAVPSYLQPCRSRDIGTRQTG